jgi:hypothetical protein
MNINVHQIRGPFDMNDNEDEAEAEGLASDRYELVPHSIIVYQSESFLLRVTTRHAHQHHRPQANRRSQNNLLTLDSLAHPPFACLAIDSDSMYGS